MSNIGYFPIVTSTIDWCEENYTHSYYIAEFYNSLSNLIFIISGIYGIILSRRLGYEKRYWFQYANNIIVGLGSIGFHATLQVEAQQMDESPMVFGIIFLFYILLMTNFENTRDKLINKTKNPVTRRNVGYYFKVLQYLIPLFLFSYACIFTRLHYYYRWTTFFQIHFLFWCISISVFLIKRYKKLNNENPSYDLDKLVFIYIFTAVIGTLFWNLDFHFCETLQWVKGHAIWHILLGINSWFGPTFAIYIRTKAQGMNPTIRWFGLGILPYIEISKLE